METIVRQLDVLRAEAQKLEAVYQKKIDGLEVLKKSVLQKAFNGVPAEPVGELSGGAVPELGEGDEPKIEKSRRDGKIKENKINHPRTKPEGVK